MGIRLRPIPRFRLFDANGSPLNGGKIYTYQPGTSTPKTTYTDYTGGTSNANPVVLSSSGEATIYWDGVYKVIATDANDVVQWTEDNYGEGEDAILTGNYNLAKNGSFEVDSNGDGAPDDWTITEYTGSGGVTLDSTEQYHGLYSLKFLSVGSGSGFAIGDYFEVQSGLTYAINFAIYSSVANIHNVVEVVWYTAAKAVISTTAVYDDETTNPTSWTYEQLEATAPATARFARVRVTGAKDDNANSGTCWFDNVSVVDVDSLYGFRFPNVNADVTSSDEELNILDGATLSTSELNGLDGLTASRAIITDGSGVLSSSATTSAEIGGLNGLTASRAIITNGSGILSTSTATSTEVGYLSGATSGVVLTTGDTSDLIAAIDSDSPVYAESEVRFRVVDITISNGNTSGSAAHGISNAYTNHRILDVRASVDVGGSTNTGGEGVSSNANIITWSHGDTNLTLTRGGSTATWTFRTLITYV